MRPSIRASSCMPMRWRSTCRRFAHAVERLVARLKSVGAGQLAPNVGDLMPPFLLPDGDGHLVSLEDCLARAPVAIAFHRGHWCPYCQINTKALAEVQDRVSAAGGQFVAITPETQRFVRQQKSDASAKFRIFSDIGNGYALSHQYRYLGRRRGQEGDVGLWPRSLGLARQRQLVRAHSRNIRRRTQRPHCGALYRSRLSPPHGNRGSARGAASRRSACLTAPVGRLQLAHERRGWLRPRSASDRVEMNAARHVEVRSPRCAVGSADSVVLRGTIATPTLLSISASRSRSDVTRRELCAGRRRASPRWHRASSQ